MNRRKFLDLSARGGGLIGLAGLMPMAACVTTSRRGAREVDPGLYVVGERHLVFDPAGAAYLLDVEGHRLVRVDRDGRDGVELAGFGSDASDLNHPIAAALDPAGRLLVLDRGNGRLQVFDADGRHAGNLVEDLHMPRDFAVAGDEVFVCDTLNHRVQVVALDGTFRRTLTANLNGPMGIAVSAAGELHVLDAGNVRVQILSAAGTPLRSYGESVLGHPRAIALAPDGRVHVADPSAATVHLFRASGEYFGRFRPRWPGGRLAVPARITPMPDGGLYIWTAGRVAHDART